MSDKKTVVIADDNDQFREMLEEYINLQDDLKVVATAIDGNQALDYIEEFNPDIVVLDIIMPYLDGLGVLERLNVHSMKKMPIIVVLSAVGQTKITEKAIKLGAAYYIMKPFDMKVLLDRIRYLLKEEPEKLINNIDNIEMYQRREIPKERTLKNEVTRLICRLGIPANLKGYKYVREAVIFTILDQSIWNTTTKELYLKISAKYNTTPMGVERAIRHSIEIGLQRGNFVVIDEIFKYTYDSGRGKPTNKEFILMIADKIHLDFPDLV